MGMDQLFKINEVFTLIELDNYLSLNKSFNRNTRNSLLKYYLKKERIFSIRRGLYSTSRNIDPYLVASKIAPDSILAYHTALEIYGKSHSEFTHFFYLSNHRHQIVSYENYTFQYIEIPGILKQKGLEKFGVNKIDYKGRDIDVTSLERTFVDILDRPELAGNWEEVWRSIEMINHLNIDQVIEYVYLMEYSSLAAKVGFFLEHYRNKLKIENYQFQKLKRMKPIQPVYLDRKIKKQSKLIKQWNLMVPLEILEQRWDESSAFI
jgi:predicted transcriptional regulator of viral defense system